jgi:LacI family transcriptional regulator
MRGKTEGARRAGGGPSITRVAEAAGVSIATVSRIVNGVEKKASAATVAKVQEAIRELGYRPGSVGRALRQGQSRLVAVLAANLANPAMTAMAASTEWALRQDGLVMVLCDTHDRAELQDEYLLEMKAQLVRGIVLLAAVDSPQLRRFAEASDPPLVFVSRRNPQGGPGPFIGIDNRRAGADVADFFLSRGERSPVVIHGSQGSSATSERVSGFLERMKAQGCVVPPGSIVSGSGPDHLRIGYEGIAALKSSRGEVPGAVFCLSDLIAFGAHRAFADRGWDPSARLIVGFDDNPLNPWVAPWLNSVEVPYSAYGAAIVQVLNGTQHAASEQILPHRLVVRSPIASAGKRAAPGF